jgi:hypothetical protein
MGIGLTAQNFKMNRLPGWDKQSYGYHGDDGNSFSSSGNGQPYGPTFTTGDVIGCGVNLIDNTCFFTKNGHHLGVAFRDLPSRLYPTVGLQTPGEIVDANFGQNPFEFDIEDMLKELRASTKAAIYSFPLPDDQDDWTVIMHKMVSSYLVHHGYSSTAEIFAKMTGQTFNESISSIKNRQKIHKLVLMGKMGQAIEQTMFSYPGLLESNENLLFMLKCRQFIEMVNGSDTADGAGNFGGSAQTSVIQSTKYYQNLEQNSYAHPFDYDLNYENDYDLQNNNQNHQDGDNSYQMSNNKKINDYIENHYHDVEMESCGNSNNGFDGNQKSGYPMECTDEENEMDIDLATYNNNKLIKSGIERMLDFGRDLFQMSQRLEKLHGVNEKNQKMLEDAFSLLAYSNPWASPLGWQLCPSRRESVCAALNSAILESMNFQTQPPMETCVKHAYELLRIMSTSSLGSCAFVNIDEVLQND